MTETLERHLRLYEQTLPPAEWARLHVDVALRMVPVDDRGQTKSDGDVREPLKGLKVCTWQVDIYC